MSDAQRIDGKAIAAALRKEVAKAAAALAEAGATPGLAVVLVGEDPASQVYVRNKAKQARAAGFHSVETRLPEDTSEEDVVATVRSLNKDPSVHGILVQLPLPKHISSERVIAAVDPEKDVDGLHPLNAGRLVLGQRGHVPCTPCGALTLVKSHRGQKLDGLTAVVIGRSILVGKPMGLLLLAENCTVTMAHSRTVDLPGLARTADILVAAVGRPEMVKGDWVKPGATVIDVGINRLPPSDPEDKGRLVGDVAYSEVAEVAGAITPVPGGVGPMTIATLLRNTLNAAADAAGKPRPEFSLKG